MKTLTCKQLGGVCDFKMTAATEGEMMQMGWKHAAEAHPERMEQTKNASQEEMEQGKANFHKIWEATPEDPA